MDKSKDNHENECTKTDESEIITTSEQQLQLGQQSRIQWMTSKREFRVRAHSNPLNDGLFNPPCTPQSFDMTSHFKNPKTTHITWCDVGCGYGGLLASLSPVFPNETMLGLEIRDRVHDFCQQRVCQLRAQYTGEYGNINFERTNAMKFLPNYFGKSTLSKIFFCYPDPHFKKKKNRQRIISRQLLDEYAYVLIPGKSIAYIVTDVEELFDWMIDRFRKHPLFEQRCNKLHDNDIVTAFVKDMTDEAKRVDKSDRSKFHASFIRLPNPI